MPTAAEIAEEIGNTAVIKRKSKVKAFTDLPGVPEGTQGYVALINGWDKWIRYRVLFENGVDLGSIDREYLVPAKEYEPLTRKRAAAIEAGVFDRPEVDQSTAAGDGAPAGDAGSGEGDVVINGVTVSGSWLRKSAAARERLGVPKP